MKLDQEDINTLINVLDEVILNRQLLLKDVKEFCILRKNAGGRHERTDGTKV